MNAKRSVAVSLTGIAEFFNPISALKFSADNLDYIPDTIHGKNSIHCMGIMGIVTPSCKMNTA